MALSNFLAASTATLAAAAPALAVSPAVVPGILSALVATLLMCGVFAYFARSTPSRALTFWTAAWSVSAARRGAELAGALVGGGFVIDALFDIAVVATSLFLLAGTQAFYGGRLHRAWWIGGAIAFVALSLGRASGASFLVVHLPSTAFLAVVLIRTGGLLLRAADPPGVGRGIAGWGLVIWGMHVLDYPFLRPVVAFAPWGFILSAVLEISVAVGFLILHLERVRHALDHSERRFRAFFDNSIDGMFRATLDGRFEAVNPALAELLGAPDAASVIRDGSLDALLPKGAAPGSNPRLLAFDPSLRPHVTHQRPDGTCVELDITSWTVHDESGGPRCYEGFVHDVTREQVIQRRLFQARKLEAIGQLAGGVAHDFNNLLTVILGCTSLLAHSDDADERAQLRADIGDAAERAADLTSKLLTFSRQRASQARRVDLVPIVSALAAMLRRLIGEDVTLDLQLDPEPCVVDAEVLLVEQCVLNLAVNARDAMPQGGRLTIRLERDKSAVVLTVTDTGVGIPPEARPHIFDPFFTTKEVGAGTGLGLATVYGAITQLDGTIDVQSQVDVGTSFVVRLPVRPAPTAEPASPELPTALLPARILLAEDEDGVRRLAERVLRNAGHQVVACADGEDAWNMFEASPERFEVLMTDVVMPRLSGSGLVARVRALRPEMPVVFVTGYPARGHGTHGAEELAGIHVDKPFTADVLVAAVAQAVALARA